MRTLNRKGHDWTIERLRPAIGRMVREKLAEPELLGRSPRRPPEDNLMKLVAAIAIADRFGTLLRNWTRCMNDRRVGAGNGNRLPSGHRWTRPVASGWFALESLADEPTELPEA